MTKTNSLKQQGDVFYNFIGIGNTGRKLAENFIFELEEDRLLPNNFVLDIRRPKTYEIGTPPDYPILDITGNYWDELNNFIDSYESLFYFVVCDLSDPQISISNIKQIIDSINTPVFKVILILADWDAEKNKNNFSRERVIESFSLKETYKNFYAISDIWFSKFFKTASFEPLDNFAAPNYYSNKDITSICADIIKCYLTENEENLPNLLQERVNAKLKK